MSAGKLIDVLDKMDRLHEMLLALCEKKADIIKQNDMDGLDQLLKDEQKYTAAIQTMEAERQREAERMAGKAEATIAECIQSATGADKERLAELQASLLNRLEQLKEINDLNQKLIYQSLQFVSMSMSMLQPQPAQATYTHPAKGSGQQVKRSMFDSQV
ncbi:flagellar protein FlgN [Pseudobacillus sp. 179-B 2D1 NHS]|uniref:flagellar protein FlgN n=1 Tax=Pseudobacillus sp. 179-B 2D1 NHS TaxID=3374292 RepID=UPI00387A46B3